jgi:hypothetical protein
MPNNASKVFLSALLKHYDINTQNGFKYLRNDCKQMAYMNNNEILKLFEGVKITKCIDAIPKLESNMSFELDNVEYNMSEMISQHFSLGKLCGNGVGSERGNVRGYYIPKTTELINKIKNLAQYAEKINNIYRQYLIENNQKVNDDLVINLTSGYRYVSNNPNSQHGLAEAIDIKAKNGDNKMLFDSLFYAIRNNQLECGQLIWEYIYPNFDASKPNLVHISNSKAHSTNKNCTFKYTQGTNIPEGHRQSKDLQMEYWDYLDAETHRYIQQNS